jgi:hypothetical protein
VHISSSLNRAKELIETLGLSVREDGMMGEDDESFYSEGEIKTRIKLMKNKSYSAPYILISDCFEEPLCDTESQMLQKAYSTTML